MSETAQKDLKNAVIRLRVLEEAVQSGGVFPVAGVYKLEFWPEGVLTITLPDGTFEQWVKP